VLRQIWPEEDEQRCWNHKVMNVLDNLPRAQRPVAKGDAGQGGLRQEPGARSAGGGSSRHGAVSVGMRRPLRPGARLEQMLTFYRFPKEH